MGLLGFIKNLGYSSDTYWWIGVISAIVTIIFLLITIYGKGDIFFTKIWYLVATAICGAIAVGAYKGYMLERDVNNMGRQWGRPPPQMQYRPPQMQYRPPQMQYGSPQMQYRPPPQFQYGSPQMQYRPPPQ